jgi:acylphosphatase
MEGEKEGLSRGAYRVVGRVQGVGFRWWTQRTACALGLGGWVRNEPDGSVVVHAVGTPGAIRRLEEALLKGPMGARVDRREEIAPLGVLEPGEFRIET